MLQTWPEEYREQRERESNACIRSGVVCGIRGKTEWMDEWS